LQKNGKKSKEEIDRVRHEFNNIIKETSRSREVVVKDWAYYY
jgi:hypothetical protein